jgi:ThiF family protein
MDGEREDRNVRLFGRDGQDRIHETKVVVVGIGGVGTHLVQQLSLLGVRRFVLLDGEQLERTNLNRYVGARADDPIPGTPKVALGERIIRSVESTADVEKIGHSVLSARGLAAVTSGNVVFGAVDDEGVRLALTEWCASFARPYIDVASDVDAVDGLRYGGRVCVAWDGTGCLACLGALDVAAAQQSFLGEAQRRDRAAIYGVPAAALEGPGPSVVSINGVVASLAVTEFMVAVTDMRPPHRLLTYRADLGGVSIGRDLPDPQCYYCRGTWACADRKSCERFLPQARSASAG